MDAHELAMQLLPTRFLDQRGRTRLQEAEEIRMRLGQPLFLLIAGREYFVRVDAFNENGITKGKCVKLQ